MDWLRITGTVGQALMGLLALAPETWPAMTFGEFVDAAEGIAQSA